jgi:ubiquinone/menaquinone biosynthesis C-methylase UbiE
MFDPQQYWNDRLTGRFDLVGVGDISQTVNYNKWSYKVTAYVLTKIFAGCLEKRSNKSVLDIGSGTGFIIDLWSKMTTSITGVDIAEIAIEKLTRKYPAVVFKQCNAGAEELPFATGSFGCCSAASVLYHIVDDEQLFNALKEINRVLEPGGYFIFSDNFIHSKSLHVTHQKCRTLEDYEKLVKRAGFEIESRQSNYVLFNDPVDSQNRFVKKLWAINTGYSRKYKWFDKIIWPLLYPIELLLTNIVKESPAQEVMVCRAVK